MEEAANSFLDAHLRCRQQGARLWEPRVLSSIKNILKTDLELGHFSYVDTDGYTGIGIKLKVIDGVPYYEYFSDESSVPMVLIDKLDWAAGHPIVDTDGTFCLGIKNKEFYSLTCDTIYMKLANPRTYLGYICEARPNVAENPHKACVIPFKYDDGNGLKVYDGCINNGTDYYNKPWCASHVDDNNIMTQMTYCLDERVIAYDAEAQGHFCNLPFYMNRRYYIILVTSET